uniref:Small ribosomal subunit protein uS17 N-terminal domain-containing protein n=1 Tax=Oryza punctata TaxID=4537 RepID=A0A0E0K2C0_ORYPU
MAEQSERAFLKQPMPKEGHEGKRPGKGGNRFWKNIGLGFKTPREAIERTYIDKKCHSLRSHFIARTCHKAKMNRTIIVHRNYLHFVKKPLSKIVRFNVLKVIPIGSKRGAGKKAFIVAWRKYQ